MSKEPANPSEKQSSMERVSAFIVDKRKAFYLLYIGVAIFCVFSSTNPSGMACSICKLILFSSILSFFCLIIQLFT